MRILIYFGLVLLLLTLDACTSGKKALERGDYDEAVMKAVNRLRRNPDHNKTINTLRKAYPLAKKWHFNRITTIERSQNPFKWEEIAMQYLQLNHLNDEIARCPGCLKVIPSPTRYTNKYDQARKKGAEVRYNLGLQGLEKGRQGNRPLAKEAYYHFQKAHALYPGYKNVVELTNEAKFYATLKVLVKPIPLQVRSMEISKEFFENKINEFLHEMPVNEFVRFYTAEEAKNVELKQPDQIIQMQFDNFQVGEVYMKEQEIHQVKDSVVLAVVDGSTGNNQEENGGSGSGDDTINPGAINNADKITVCHIPPGEPDNVHTIVIEKAALQTHLDHGDQIGACADESKNNNQSISYNTTTRGHEQEENDKFKVYGQVKATMHIYTKILSSRGIFDFKIIDGYTNKVLTQEKLPGEYIWEHQWGYFNGDERAVEPQYMEIVNNKDLPPPPPQDLFIGFTQPIYNQITAKIGDFYRHY